MILNHRELRAFLAIARFGSINAASQKIGLTQPALSRSLSRLETTLGAPLFDRHVGGMTITPFGEALQRHAERIEFETARVVEEIRMLNGAATGYVRVGIVPSTITTLLQPTIAAMTAAAPDIQIQLVEGAGDAMRDAVVAGRVDFALIGQIDIEDAAEITITSILKEEVCIAARCAHPLMAKDMASFADLAPYRWVLPETGNAIWVGVDRLFRRNGLEPPTPVVVTNSVHSLKSLICAEDYLTMMTRVIFAREEQHGMMAPLPVPGSRWLREVMLVRRNNHHPSPAEEVFLTALNDQVRTVGSGAIPT